MDNQCHAQETSHPDRKLLLIDGCNVLRACFEANPTPELDGRVKGALQAALSVYRRLLRAHAPHYALVAFDHGGPTFRSSILATYRSTRAPMPEALRNAMPTLYDDIQQHLGLASVSVPGVEADDVIATMVHAWFKRGGTAVEIVSNDKDLLQLVPVGATVYHPFKDEVRDAAWIVERFGVPAERFIDFLSLVGDPSDDVPGVAGIGAKTAVKLVNDIGDVCALLDASTKMEGPIGEKLRAGIEDLVHSRMLIGLRTDVPLGVTWRQMQVRPAMAAAA